MHHITIQRLSVDTGLKYRAKDGGNKEEASCGAGTGMQMDSLTRWFLLVGL